MNLTEITEKKFATTAWQKKMQTRRAMLLHSHIIILFIIHACYVTEFLNIQINWKNLMQDKFP